MPVSDASNPTSLPEWLAQRAARHGERIAVTFVADDGSELSWSYAELWARAGAVAARLPRLEVDAPRALLLFPPGLEFIAGFLGCQIAGWIPVPTCYPKPGRSMPRLDSAARDCAPAALLGDAATLRGIDRAKLDPAARALPLIATDADTQPQRLAPEQLSVDPDRIGLLQYTSGSTSEPKGVMVRHRNLIANLEAIRRGFQIDWQPDRADRVTSAVFWLPFFHDMGLIGGILAPLYVGGRTVLISPRSFLQRPLRWLQLISDYRAEISGAPNFAYQLCVDRISPEHVDRLDLTHWRLAFCGAEPILWRTLHDFGNRFASCGFSASTFYPCYGLAEATLLAAGGEGPGEPEPLKVQRRALGEGRVVLEEAGRGERVQRLVSCGRAALGTEIRIVDPKRRSELDERQIGEIWLRGASIATGYWNREQERPECFGAEIEGSEGGFFRTGDLGFLHRNELYVTGRLKDVVILRGRNHFPQDIEATVREALGEQAGACAAFAVEGPRGEALAIVAEVPRHSDSAALPEMVRTIRRQVIDVHEVDPRHVWLARPAAVPVTSSGKVQRSRCREQFLAEQLRTKYRYSRVSASEQMPIPVPPLPAAPTAADRDRIAETIGHWLGQWLISRGGVAPEDVRAEKSFTEYGLDSMTAVELSGELEEWVGVELTPVVAWNHPTINTLSRFIASEIVERPAASSPVAGHHLDSPQPSAPTPPCPPSK